MIRGRELAVWLARTHPQLLAKVAARMPRQLGDDGGLVNFDFSSIGEDLAPSASVTAAVDESSWLSSFQPTLVDVTADLPDTISQVESSSSIDWGSIFNTGAKVASNLPAPAKSPVSGVGQFLSSPTGINTLVSAAGDFFKAQASQANAQAQAAIVQAQAARAAAGKAPAPIVYTTNPYTGQVVPVVNTSRGTLPVTQPVLSSLLPSGLEQVFNQYGVWILAGLGVVLVVASMRNGNG